MPITTPQVQPLTTTQGNGPQNSTQGQAMERLAAYYASPAGIDPAVWAAMDDATKATIASLTRKAQAQGTTGRLSLKVSEKGALSVYGLGRFPVTLYASQWTRLLAAVDELKGFIEANKGALAEKQ